MSHANSVFERSAVLQQQHRSSSSIDLHRWSWQQRFLASSSWASFLWSPPTKPVGSQFHRLCPISVAWGRGLGWPGGPAPRHFSQRCNERQLWDGNSWVLKGRWSAGGSTLMVLKSKSSQTAGEWRVSFCLWNNARSIDGLRIPLELEFPVPQKAARRANGAPRTIL